MPEPIAIAGVGALAFAALAWLLGGRIRTTDADKLWHESREIRRELREQIDRLEGRLDDCEKRHDSSTTEVARLVRQIEKLEFEAVQKDQTIAQQLVQIQQLTARVVSLEAKA